MSDDGRHTHCAIRYFKDTGKYYSDGEHAIMFVDGKPVPFYECVRIIREMLDAGKRPGLVDGFEFDAVITVYSEFGPLSVLYTRPRLVFTLLTDREFVDVFSSWDAVIDATRPSTWGRKMTPGRRGDTVISEDGRHIIIASCPKQKGAGGNL